MGLLEGGDDPTVEEALRRPDRLHWVTAMDSEYKSLTDKETWGGSMPCPRNHKPIGVKWVLKLKRLPDGRLDKYKARLVAKGYSQVQGVDYDLLFAPVAKRTSLLYFLHVVAAEDMECHVLDYKTAFLNGTLDEDIYIEQPQRFQDGTTNVLKLKKAIYGLKQAPRQWYKALSSKLKELGFVFCAVDGAVARATFESHLVYITFYVDDMLIASKCLPALTAAKKALLRIYEGTDKGELKDFLGLVVHRRRAQRRLYVDQSAYAHKVLAAAGLTDVIPKWIPLQPNPHATPNGPLLPKDEAELYRKRVGELMYLANTSRPDLAYAAGYLAKHLQAPFHAHSSQLWQTLAYLKATQGYVLTLGCVTDDPLLCFVDSDYGQEPGRRNVCGFCFQIHGCTFSWKSKRLGTVVRSSMEAELTAAGEAVREAVFVFFG